MSLYLTIAKALQTAAGVGRHAGERNALLIDPMLSAFTSGAPRGQGARVRLLPGRPPAGSERDTGAAVRTPAVAIARLWACTALALLAFAAPAQAIVGGTQSARSWPHMAALEVREADGTWRFICGASLVRPEVVLTAAHCIDGSEGTPGSFRLLLGTKDRAQGGERIEVARIVEHPSYDTGDGGYDVALLKLARAALQGSPIRIADAGDAHRYEPGDIATIVGWGATFFAGPPERNLREAEVPIRSDDDCERSYTVTASFDRATMICAGYEQGGADSCQGDSGGPLMVPDAAGNFLLVAAVSFGLGCAFPTQYGVYSEVAGQALRPWVEARLAELSPAAPPPPGADPGAGEGAPSGSGSQTGSAGGGALVGADAQPTRGARERTRPRIRLRLSRRLGSAARARRAKRLGLVLATSAPLRAVRVTLRQRSRTVGYGRLRSLTRRGRLILRVGRRLRAGPVVLTVTARDGDGRHVRVVRHARLSR